MSGMLLSLVALCLLASFGFAFRGIVLLLMRDWRPGRVVTMSGAVAMVSTWLFTGLLPPIAVAVAGIFNEFDLDLRPTTELVIAVGEMAHHFGLIWYPCAFGLGLCALLLPEILFSREVIEPK
jgi:hypothetical protein